MTSSTIETRSPLGSAPATEALETFMSHHYHQHPQHATLSRTDAKDRLPSATARPALKRVRSVIISPSNSALHFEEHQQQQRPVEPLEPLDPLDLSTLASAAGPVADSVAFPVIEWISDDDDDDDDENDSGGCGSFQRPLEGIGNDDDDDDDDNDGPVFLRPRKRRSGSGFSAHLHRSKSRKSCLDSLGGGRHRSSAIVSPGTSFGADQSCAGPVSAALWDDRGSASSRSRSPSPLWGQFVPADPSEVVEGEERPERAGGFAVSLRPSSPDRGVGCGMRRSRSSRNFLRGRRMGSINARAELAAGASSSSSPFLLGMAGALD